MFSIGVSTDIKPDVILRSRGMNDGGRVQKVIDNEVLRLCDPYTPFDTGELIRSGIRNTDPGSGMVRYETPYARRQYYIPMTHEGLRCAYWFEQMKANGGKQQVLKVARKEAGL